MGRWQQRAWNAAECRHVLRSLEMVDSHTQLSSTEQ